MKIQIYLTAAVLFFSCGDQKQKAADDKYSIDSMTTDSIDVKQSAINDKENVDPIDLIKKDYQILEEKLTENKLETTKISYENDETSGEIVFYRENDTIKIIKHRYSEHSHFSAEENYYIKDDGLFFVYLQEVVWSFDGGTPEKPDIKDDILEKRIYFNQNNPILCLEKQYIIKSNEIDVPDSKKTPNRQVPCNTDEILKTFNTLLKHSNKKGKISSL